MSYVLLAGPLIAFFLLGYGLCALLSRRRRRRRLKVRSSHHFFSAIRTTNDELTLNDAVDAFTRARESGRLGPIFALLGQTSAYLALGEEEHAETAYTSALEYSRAAPPSAERNSGLSLSCVSSELWRLDKARRSRYLKNSAG